MTIEAKRTRRSSRRARTYILRGVICLAVVGCVGACLLSQHRPAWYQPVLLDEAGLEAARLEATREVDRVSGDMVQGVPFEVALTEQALTRWLITYLHHGAEMAGRIPPEFRDPVVNVSPGRIRIGATYDRSGWRAIVSLSFNVAISKDGSRLAVAVRKAAVGSLPMPRWLLNRLGDHLAFALAQSSSDRRITLDWMGSDEQDDPVRDVPNRFVWPNGDRAFRIGNLELTPGRILLHVVPQ